MSRKLADASYYAANREKIRARHAAYFQAHKGHLLARRNERHQECPEKRIQLAAIYREKNKALLKSNDAKYAADHKDKICAKTRLRQANALRATPPWANKFFISEAYHLAKLRTQKFGFKWHVDHIVPLRSKIVCGLHVEHNLQVIPAIENLRKHNRIWPDMPID